MVRIWWSDEDEAFIAVDEDCPRCSAVGETEMRALDELNQARIAWFGAKIAALEGNE
jgi:hypothetical protein